MTDLDILDASSIDQIAALCARSLADPPSAEELRRGLFAPDQPATVRGDPSVGVVATVEGGGEGYLRLLVVDPSSQGEGHGRALLQAAEGDVAHLASMTVGADPPYFLFPGVETTQTAMLCLLERRRFHRIDANFNMGVDLLALPPDPGGPRLATAGERDEVGAWMGEHWAGWKAEALRALDQGTLLISRDAEGISGFCAYEVNRSGLLGPIAARPSKVGKGVGVPLLLGALHRMRMAGLEHAEVVWVGPIVPYARIGATVSRVFFVYRKDVRA